MGKPVITFGRHNMHCFLPHVFTITDELQLRPAINRILSDAIDLDQARRDGQRFLAAAVACSFDALDFGLYVPGKPRLVTDAAAENACTGLIESLSWPQSERAFGRVA